MSVADPRVRLSRARVLDAAVAVADAQGIDALTLRRLAQTLHVHPTSIYNHLPNKEAILDGLSERLVEEAQLPSVVDTWQEWVWGFATAMRTLARAHPGAFAVFTRRPAQGPSAAAHVEAALGAFQRAGFSTLQANQAMAGVALAIMGLALNEAPGVGPAPTPGLAHFEPELYPRIAEAVRLVPESTDGMWRMMVGAIVEGLEAAAGQP